MRSVSTITAPAIGMNIGWRVGGGKAESEIKYGEVVSVKVHDVTGDKTYVTKPAGDEFCPALGDTLVYYGLKPKGGRATRNPEANEQREVAYRERTAVLAEIAALERKVRWLQILGTVTGTLLVAAGATAFITGGCQ